MRRRPGYFRVAAAVSAAMLRHSARNPFLPWILLAAPLTAWILVGRMEIPIHSFLASAFTWCIPTALVSGWLESAERERIALIIRGTRADSKSMHIPEILFPLAAGSVPAISMILSSPPSGGIPWQLWTVIFSSSLTAVSASLLLERHLGTGGYLLNLMGFMAQASRSSWAESWIFQLPVPQGYTLWTLEWSRGRATALHGDFYAFFSVIAGVGLTVLAAKILNASR